MIDGDERMLRYATDDQPAAPLVVSVGHGVCS